jgi:hypothetical protein
VLVSTGHSPIEWRLRATRFVIRSARLRPNVSLQLTSARSAEALRLSAYRDAIASNLVSRILSRPLAAELWR